MSLYQRIGGKKITPVDTFSVDCIEPEQVDYLDWQDGFGADWDLAIADAPLLYADRVLHVYTEVDFLQMRSNFPTTIDIVTYNPETDAYRRITPSATKLLTIVESDKFTNSHDGLKYVCVIYVANLLGTYYFRIQLPVVYSNTKGVADFAVEQYFNLIGDSNLGTTTYYPFLRGADLNTLTTLNLYNGIEHISCQSYGSSLPIKIIQGGNLAIGIFKKLIDEMPLGTGITLYPQLPYFVPYISNEKLANWFYNYFLYTYYDGFYSFSGNTFYNFATSNITRQFKINSNLVLNAGSNYNQLHSLPNAMYLTGTITELQTTTTYAGYHGFNLTAYTLLRNFPMWTVLEGASYGCLKPMTAYSTRGNFRFVSTNLEREYFAQFDELGELILDPTLTFIANLPIETVTGATITFDDKTFKDKFTSAEQEKIVTLVTTIKKWTLAW